MVLGLGGRNVIFSVLQPTTEVHDGLVYFCQLRRNKMELLMTVFWRIFSKHYTTIVPGDPITKDSEEPPSLVNFDLLVLIVWGYSRLMGV